MPEVLDLSNERWMNYKPPKKRDVRKIFGRFWKPFQAEAERETRIRILSKGQTSACNVLADLLSEARRRRPASTGCCPLVARQFQIFFASRALRIAKRQDDDGVRYTFLDKEDAVPIGQLNSIDWIRLHVKFRKRLERYLGKNVVVYGMGEVEFDESRGVWQPHFHVTIHGATEDTLKMLRKAYYRAKLTGLRPMIKSKPQALEGWLTYVSKLVAFGKNPELGGPSRRCRLLPAQSLEYFLYLAHRRPTSFVFAMNCRIVKFTGRKTFRLSTNAPRKSRRKTRTAFGDPLYEGIY